MSKTKLTATDSFSETFTRTTARDYKFVIVTRADQNRVASLHRDLDELIARRDEIGNDGIERAEQSSAKCGDLISEALDSGNYALAQYLKGRRHQHNLDSRLNVNIKWATRGLAEAEAQAAASTVISVTWTSRIDLAQKAAAKASQNGSVEIVSVS